MAAIVSARLWLSVIAGDHPSSRRIRAELMLKRRPVIVAAISGVMVRFVPPIALASPSR